jgi:hypothetical protein
MVLCVSVTGSTLRNRPSSAPNSPLPVLVGILGKAPVHPIWKCRYMQLDALGTALSSTIHSSWRAAYKKEFGGMKEFVLSEVCVHVAGFSMPAVPSLVCSWGLCVA